jgi:hypothetical protein
MKKMLSLALVAVMVLSAIPAVHAADITVDTTQSSNTVVSYGVAEGYTVVIPDAVELDAAGTGTATLSAENVIIASGKTLNIRISGADYVDAWELIDKADADNALTYSIKNADGEALANNDIVLSSASGANWNSKASATLSFAIEDAVTSAGEYEDTLTFTVSVD